MIKTEEDNKADATITKGEIKVQEHEGTFENQNKDDMAGKCEISIPVFDGQDYKMWKTRMKMYLKFKKCEEVTTRERTNADKEDEWLEKELKAMNHIYSAISNRQLEFVCEEESPYKVIKKLDSMYLKESTALQIVCRNKLEKLKLNNYSNTEEFFSDFEKAINDLKSAGAQLNEKEKLNYMLNTLPESYSYIGDLIDTLKEEEQTADYIRSKIKLAEMRKQKEIGERNSNAFVAKKNESCYKCGKAGHYAKECRSSQAVNRGRGRGRGRSESNRGNHSRGRGRGQRNQQGSTNEQSSEGASAWVATISETNSEVNDNTPSHMTSLENLMQGINCANTERECNEINWLLDSGCSDHIINNENYFDKFVNLKEPVKIYLGDDRYINATKIGNVTTYFEAFGKQNKVNIKNVYFAKDMNRNLISYGKLTDNDNIVIVGKGKIAKIIDNEKVIAVAYKENKIYTMKSKLKYKVNSVNNAERNNMSQKERWHRMLGHVNFGYLGTLSKQQLLTGIPSEFETEFLKCKICIENKMHNLPFENNRSKANNILEIIHTDVCGPFKTTGFNGEKYFVSFIDDYSKIAKVYCIKSKDEVSDCLVQFVNETENLTGKHVKILRCDNGKEYLNNRIYKFARGKGIILNNCPPYVHELNGTAERFNRTIMDMTRCLLAESKVHKCYWPEIVCAATYLKNRTLANTIEKKTPFEIFFGKKPNVENLRLYGSKVFVRKPEQKRSSKWDAKAEMGILLGYSEVGYRILLNSKIIVARHVEFIEDVNCIGLPENDSDNESSISSSESESLKDEVFDSAEETDINEKSTEKVELKVPRRSTRDKKSPKRYPEKESYNIYVNYSKVDTPCSFEEAINSVDSQKWKEAMDKEIESLNENNTWQLVNKVEDKEILEVKWVYKKKSDETYKARLVVRGFQQTDVMDDIYAPVAKIQTLKIFLSFGCQFKFNIEQMDVVTAFLNGKISTEVYVTQPKGYDDGTKRVCKLSKALYGLRESSRAWYECFDEYLINLGFERSNVDNCLYTLGTGKDIVYILIYVDDLLIGSKNKKRIKRIKKLLSKKFKMKDLGKVKEYLGIIVDYDYRINEMKLHQTNYLESLADKYKIKNGKLYNTPMETNLKIEKAEESNPDIKYRNLIGALLYISASTRPDISHSVNYLSRYQNCYNETHWKYALRILKYLYLTKDLSLIYKRNENCDTIDCYVDADWAGDNIDRKSTSGYLIRVFGNVIDWKSRKQKVVTKASTYAEYVALSEAVSEVKFVKELLKTFHVNLNNPIKMYEDNLGAINIANYGNFTKNSKHIEIHYHYVHESVKENEIEIIKVGTDENIADIFTKALCKDKFIKFREMLNVM